MTFHVKQGGVWKDAEVHVKHGGSWKRAEVWVKQSGTWKLVASVGPTYTPVPGTYSASNYASVSYSLNCSEAATWTFTLPGGMTASRASGTSGTSVTFSLDAVYNDTSGTYLGRSRTVAVTATVSGQSVNFNITLEALGD